MSAELISRADWIASLYRQFTTMLEGAAQRELQAIQRAAAIGDELLRTRGELGANFSEWLAAAEERIGFGERQARRFVAVASVVEKCGSFEKAIRHGDAYDAICRELNLKGREAAALEGPKRDPEKRTPFFSFAVRVSCDPGEMPVEEARQLFEKIKPVLEIGEKLRERLNETQLA